MITMKYVDDLNGRQFEIFTGKLFKDLGFHNIKITKSSGDHGLDVLAESVNSKVIGVQCKHLDNDEYIGYGAVEETFTGQAYYNADDSILLTNQRITNNAKRSAKNPNINVRCWDRNNLRDLISIANNINNEYQTNEFINIQDKFNEDHFDEGYSLRDMKLFSVLSAKIVKSNYSKHIKLNVDYLNKALNLNNEQINTGYLYHILDENSVFVFNTGSVSLYVYSVLNNNNIIFYIDGNFINLLKGKCVFD